MVDPNPARGMPLALQRYWLVGKGAAKIRWDVPGDFLRCVRQLRKYFPKNPKGLCNILHQKATGGAPGHGRLEKLLPGHAMDDGQEYELALVAAAELLQAQPRLGQTWAAPVAPIGIPTGEPRRMRVFDQGALKHRPLPIPLAFQRQSSDTGHSGAVTVGRCLGMSCGPGPDGQEYMWAWGDWLDSSIVPEVTEAAYLVDQGIIGPSVDPGGPVRMMINPENGAEHMQEYTVGRVTLVPIPAFVQGGPRMMNLGPDYEWPDGDEDMPVPEDMPDMEPDEEEDAGEGQSPMMPMPREHRPMPMASDECGCRKKAGMAVDGKHDFAVNTMGWRGLPLAARSAVFDNDEAVTRIGQWAGVSEKGADVAKLNRAFMWRDRSKPATDITAYRLPVGDIINGQLTVVFHAIYAAAALLGGAHGGLPDVPDEDKNALKPVISAIYQEMAKEFNDTSIRAPWDRGQEMGATMEFAENPELPYGDVVYADPGYQKDKKKRYPLDTEKHVRAAWGYINQADNAQFYSPKQLAAIRRRIIAAAKKLGISIEEKATEFALSAMSAPLQPPAAWFDNPALGHKTRLTVEPSGRVYGHLAAWDECHSDLKEQHGQCVRPPKSRMGYAPFHLGEVLTAEGDAVRVGKIVMDTRHAGLNLGYAAAAIHYDNTGDEIAIVRAGEDDYGIWVAGCVVPEATQFDIAKLRRSPLSGDWRGVNGALELTAALAVNVPAFPVYSVDDGNEPNALIAGSVVFIEDEVDEAQEDRGWSLRQIIDDEETFAQRTRARKLFALLGEETPADAGALAGDGQTVDVDAQRLADELAMERDAVYSIVEEPVGAEQPEDESSLVAG